MAGEQDSGSSRDTTGEPLVTVGLPVFDGERYLAGALDALLAQGHRNLEVIVSDNASTDGTERIGRAYAERDPRVRYRRNGANLGALPNAQRTLDAARGEYFMWAAHDDLWEPGFVGTLWRLLDEHPAAALAFCRFDGIDEGGCATRTYEAIFELPVRDPYERLRAFLAQPVALGKANLFYALYRTAALREAGGTGIVAPDLHGADVLVVFRVLSLGQLVLAPELLFHKRVVAGAPSTDPGGGAKPHLGWRRELQAELAHFAGYEPLIEAAPGLATVQREALKAQVQRLARARARAVRFRKLVVNRLRRPARSVRRWLRWRRP